MNIIVEKGIAFHKEDEKGEFFELQERRKVILTDEEIIPENNSFGFISEDKNGDGVVIANRTRTQTIYSGRVRNSQFRIDTSVTVDGKDNPLFMVRSPRGSLLGIDAQLGERKYEVTLVRGIPDKPKTRKIR